MSQILKMCGYKRIFRGSSKKRSVRKREVLFEFIKAFQEVKQAAVGITVDGSNGPGYRLKKGIIVIAHRCKIPIYISRIWCQRKVLLPTWDRTTIPLPFNRIYIRAHGPYQVPEDLKNSRRLEDYRRFLENELLELTHNMFLKIDGQVSLPCKNLFPDNWTPQWPEDEICF